MHINTANERRGLPPPDNRHGSRWLIVLSVLGLAAIVAIVHATAAPTQPFGPPPPTKYKIKIRYNILAPRDPHVALYKAMIGDLQKIGFDFQPPLQPFPNTDYEDPNKNTLAGVIASNQALKVFDNPSVAAALLMPLDYQLPADSMQPVRVRLELASGFTASRQLALVNQVRPLLTQLDFKESTGYDHRGYSGKPHTRIVGTVPAEHLETLLKDLRTQPTGWLAPRVQAESLPLPVSQVVPIVVTEVVPEPTPAVDAPAPSKRGQSYLDKITPDLWAMLVGKDEETKIVRAEIILSYVPPAGDETYRPSLTQEAPSLLIEGRLGPVVTGWLRVNQASGLAGLSQVSVVRLARPAMVHVDPSISFPADNPRALKQSGLETLHQRGFKGKGIRVGIIDSDFRGHEALVLAGKLPRGTRLLDMTREFNPDLYPDPQPSDVKSIGHGTHCALAAALAAPEAELTLIRIDPTSLLQLQLIAKVVNGEPAIDDLILRRLDEIRNTNQELLGRREVLMAERQTILNNFDDDSELKRQYDLLGPIVRGWLFTPREWHAARMSELERDRESQRRLELRFHEFYDSLRQLKGMHIVCTSLVWNDGYPLNGNDPLSKWFDEEKNCKSLWFVSTGNTRNQAWTGSFRDADGNGVMEFAPPVTKLRSGVWTPALSFLAWQPYAGDEALELAPGTKVRITAQWSEPHDPSYFWTPKEIDRYLKPLADLSLVLLRQRDPSGKLLSADDCEVAARSPVPAFRIDNHPSGATYEQIVEFTVAKGGRFALQVQRGLPTRWELQKDPTTGRFILTEVTGLSPTGIRPLDVPNLPGLEPQWELRPRIFVSVVDPPTAAKGRVVFRDFSTNLGNIALPADARSSIAVGAASFADEPRPYSSVGTPGTLWGFVRPNLFSYDSLALTPPGTGSAFGASLATPFAAGQAAALLSAGQRREHLQMDLQRKQAAIWRIGSGK